ncbi:MAG: hypothetical protein KatS3mg048_4006 [Caldilinea sp.]|jgi:hypothetical protein|nr:MAG: hypothetical protein KatS3mg048_4006 [Caldilinea sp.]
MMPRSFFRGVARLNAVKRRSTGANPRGWNPSKPACANSSSFLARLPGLLDIERYAEEITGPDETMDVVVNLSNRVNITFTPPTAP